MMMMMIMVIKMILMRMMMTMNVMAIIVIDEWGMTNDKRRLPSWAAFAILAMFF